MERLERSECLVVYDEIEKKGLRSREESRETEATAVGESMVDGTKKSAMIRPMREMSCSFEGDSDRIDM